MSTTTPKLGLKKPDGTDPFLRQDFADNYDKLDANPGVYICDSTTKPVWGASQAGRLIWLTDYKQLQFWDGTTWNDERTATPMFAGGAVFDATIGKNATPIYNIINFTTPRPCTLAIFMNCTVSCAGNATQDVYFRVNFDGSDQFLGAYSDTAWFAGGGDSSHLDQATITAMALVSCTKGSHSIKGKVVVGTFNTSVTVRGIKAIGLMGLYSSSNSL